ncbi:hypothetical protein [Parvicella tangerina]|uniref:Uncharacterized protein n=1 Tax=Parvicella tangerina TaxID=2829795 RepID=A0A916JRK2_9FLAO|nr:hypothetical protein [Parvicella tangerina]CAG5087778.1 hypothetical protein CRYO30217_03577 [Parvicella tangerina]
MSVFKYSFKFSTYSNLLSGLKSSNERFENVSVLDDSMIESNCYYVYPIVNMGRAGKFKLKTKIKELPKNRSYNYNITVDVSPLVFGFFLTFLAISVLAYFTIGITLIIILAIVTAGVSALFLSSVKNQVSERLKKYATQQGL